MLASVTWKTHIALPLAYLFPPPVAPTRYQPIIRRDREDPDHPKLLQSMKWGLIPSWNKTMPDYTFTMRTINARDDKVKEAKSMWSGVKQTKRCVVIAEGFYEWLKKGKEKQPYFVQWEDNRLMCFAGLYDHAVIDGMSRGRPMHNYGRDVLG